MSKRIEEIKKLLPEIYCDVPPHYGIKAVHATATKDSNGKRIPPYLVALLQESGDDLAQAILQSEKEMVGELVDSLRYLTEQSIDAYKRIEGGTYSLAQAIDDAKQALSKFEEEFNG